MKAKTLNVTYTTSKGETATITVKGRNESEAINNAKNQCFTGCDFRCAVLTNENYVKPSNLGFAGTNRAN